VAVLPFSQVRTNALAENTANIFAKAGFKVERPDSQRGTRFFKVTINQEKRLSLQIYSTGTIQIRAQNPSDESDAIHLLQRYGVGVDNEPFRIDAYTPMLPREEAANDSVRLWLRTQFDNWNLEYVIRILVNDLQQTLTTGRVPTYADSLPLISDNLNQVRLRTPFAPTSSVLRDIIDPSGTRAPWIDLNQVAAPEGSFGKAIDIASAALKQVLCERDGLEKLEAKHVTDFETFVAQDVAKTIPESLRIKIANRTNNEAS